MQNVIDAATGSLESHAVPIATRKSQKLALAANPRELLFLVRKGLFIVRAPITAERFQVSGILYPGDLLRTQAMLPLDGTEIACASQQGEVWRVPWSNAKDLLDTNPDLARTVADRLADLAARATLHGAVTTALSGDERVAALFLELALRTSRRTPAGLVFDMPLSRMDVAEYLALNPDTVSRIVSRMRRAGILMPAGRNRLVCPSLEALARACPLSTAVLRLHKQAPAQAPASVV